MAFTTHWRSSWVASRLVEDVVEASDALDGGSRSTKELEGASDALDGGFELTKELEDASASCCGSGVDEVFEGMAWMSWSSSFGRERASATTFALPLRYLMSVVYSEMQAS